MNYTEAIWALKHVKLSMAEDDYICVRLFHMEGAGRISKQVYKDLTEWIREQLNGYTCLEFWLRYEHQILSKNKAKMFETRKAWIDHMIEVLHG